MNKKHSIITLIVWFVVLIPVQLLSQTGKAWVRYDYHIQGTHFYPYPAARQLDLAAYDILWDKAGKVHFAMTGDVDGDGQIELLTSNYQTLRVFDKAGNLEWSANVAANLGALADVTGDGVPEILLMDHRVSSYIGAILVYDGSGNLLKALTGSKAPDGGFSRCWAGDFDGDGRIEVSVDMVASWTAHPRGLYMFDYETGNLDWFYDIGPYGRSRIGDIDEDGKLEFVFGGGSWHNGGRGAGVNNTATPTTDGDIFTIVFNAEDGSERFTMNYFSDGQSNGYLDHAVVDLDHDGDSNILTFEGHSRWYHGTLQVHLVNENGIRLKTWNGPYVNYGDAHGMSWAVGDLDGDGLDEVAVNYMSLDGLWLLDHNLNPVKKRTFGRWLHNGYDGYHVINDIDGDGVNELIVADWYEGKIRVMDAQLDDKWVYPVTSGRFYTVLSDLDNDGVNEIIVTGDHLYVLGIPDTIPPELNPSATPSLLWPPNHKMVDITVVANAWDNSGLPVTLTASVSSSEPVSGLGDGDTAPDWTEPVIDQETGIIHLQLRAERSGKGNGRIYTITVTATDGSGNSASETVEVRVPHNKKKR